ncbi:MAG TPA: YceI family protein [Candidatus Eisenbacteria bacterium]|jgi:polyisoprenoid-binding protein YceI
MKHATRFLAAFALLAASASFAAATPTTWKIDPAHTEAGFEVRHFFAKVHGVFHAVEGTIVFDEADPTAIKIEAMAKVRSIDTGEKKRDAHLQSSDFFNADKDSILTFKSAKVVKQDKNKYKITGDLTMRGVTKSVTFDAEFLGSSAVSVEGQSWGSKAGFSATTVVNRKDWGINWNKTLDNGGVMVDDNVTIILNVEADKAQ